MTHVASHIIINSAVGESNTCDLPDAVIERLNGFVGTYGSNAAEVAKHFICSRVGEPETPTPELPEQAARDGGGNPE